MRLSEKAEYDKRRRRDLRERLKEEKRAYHARTYDHAKARTERKKRGDWHTKYCQRYYAIPKNKRAKVAYDMDRRAAEYGPYAEAYKVWLQLTKLVRKLVPDKYERLRARGYYEREAWKRRSRRAC